MAQKIGTKGMSEIEEELNNIREWCRVAIEFMRKRDPSPQWFFDSFEGIVLDTVEAKNLQGARQMRKEVAEMMLAMTRDDVRELDNLLFEKFGRGLKSRL